MLSELHYPPVRKPVANAILTATGERLQRLPVDPERLRRV